MLRITADKKKLTLLHLSFIHSLSKMLVNHGRSHVPITHLCNARLRTNDARSAFVRPMREILTGANITTVAHNLTIDGLFWKTRRIRFLWRRDWFAVGTQFRFNTRDNGDGRIDNQSACPGTGGAVDLYALGGTWRRAYGNPSGNAGFFADFFEIEAQIKTDTDFDADAELIASLVTAPCEAEMLVLCDGIHFWFRTVGDSGERGGVKRLWGFTDQRFLHNCNPQRQAIPSDLFSSM